MAYKTITLNGDPIRKEYTANAAITPGMLIELMSTGKVRAHASASQPAAKMFALEDDLQGREIDTAYAASNEVQCGCFHSGQEVLVLIANGEDIAIGDKLESNGDGYLKEYTASSAGAVEYPASIVAVALEACDMSGSSAADPTGRCRVEII